MAWLACGLSGCTQQYYRIQADKEVKYLVTQKSNDPRWEYDSFTIGMDPRSRYFDPTDPDGPPMPYDDPASHLYMHCVAGKKAYPCWHMQRRLVRPGKPALEGTADAIQRNDRRRRDQADA